MTRRKRQPRKIIPPRRVYTDPHEVLMRTIARELRRRYFATGSRPNMIGIGEELMPLTQTEDGQWAWELQLELEDIGRYTLYVVPIIDIEPRQIVLQEVHPDVLAAYKLERELSYQRERERDQRLPKNE